MSDLEQRLRDHLREERSRRRHLCQLIHDIASKIHLAPLGLRLEIQTAVDHVRQQELDR